MILRPPSLASGRASAAPAFAPRAANAAAARASSPRRRTTVAAPRSAAPADVFALDFDGVLVDSEPEVSHSAIQALSFKDWSRYVPAVAGGDDQQQEQQRALLLAALKRVRPVLVRGYEAVVMARLLGEELFQSSSSADAAVERILSDWPGELEKAMRRFGETDGRAALESHFERARAASMAGAGAEAAAWLALNRPYPTKGDALRAAVCEEAAGPIYFVSSKKASRVSALLSHHFSLSDVGEDSPRLFASLLPPETEKRRALAEIMARPVASGARRLHFVDDRLDTLLAVREDRALAERWQLYLAAWGYCAPGEVDEAARTPGVRVLGRPEELAELLRWGLVSGGVDDGCEPQEEEKEAAGWL